MTIERFLIPFELSEIDHVGDELVNEIEQADGSSIFTLAPKLLEQLNVSVGDCMEFIFDTETLKMTVNIVRQGTPEFGEFAAALDLTQQMTKEI